MLMGVSLLETCSEEAALRVHGEVVESPTVNLLHHSRSRVAAHRYKVRLFYNVNANEFLLIGPKNITSFVGIPSI